MALLCPSAAWAEACATLRPNWDGTPATQVTEAVGLFTSPIGLFLGAALLVAVVFRHPWGATLITLLWSVFVMVISAPDADGQDPLARAEGCMASPALFIGLSAAICGLAVMYTFRRETRP